MTAIAERYDAASALTAPPPPQTGDYINDLRDSSGLIIGKVDWVGKKLFGASVIEELVTPFAGDWAHLDVAAGGWMQLGGALDATAANIDGAWEALAQSWQGAAASAAQLRFSGAADLHRSQAEGCRIIAGQCRTIIEIAQAAGVVLASALKVINDILLQLLAEAAVPILGWAAAAALAPVKAGKFFLCMKRVAAAIERIVNAVKLAVRIVGLLKTVIGAAGKVMATSTRVVQVGNIQMTDEVTRVQFGVAR
ncbi:MAG: hypothetical protein ACT4P1_12465 [Sporichthyaceae bacterium]